MLQMTEAIMDEELGAVSFSVLRTFYRKEDGEKVLLREDRYETLGAVHPAKLDELQLLPEEYRSQQVLLIHSPVPLSLGRMIDDQTFTAPDQIILHFQTWLVIAVRDWSAFGFCRALAVLQG